jgi:tRNA A-37 threonylcarbamoyl transferase component Bud32
MMIQQRVLHGDLSPNNFIIHEGIGYFIDFDHASIMKEGETFTISFGTVSLNVEFAVLVIDRWSHYRRELCHIFLCAF